jgi:hypothetical protein
MPELLPTVDYNAVKSVEDLPISWMSTQGRDLKAAGAYELECKSKKIKPDPAKLAKLIGGNMIHSRKTTLENGLRYITFHTADGTQVFDDKEYAGLWSCSCGEIKNQPHCDTPKFLKGANLGDGFKLITTIVGITDDGRKISDTFAEKKFSVGKKDVEISYTIQPPTKNQPSRLYFNYEETTNIDIVFPAENARTRKIVEYEKKSMISKKVHVEIRSDAEKDGKFTPYCNTNLRMLLVVPPYRIPDYEYIDRDQIDFEFGTDGKIIKIKGISTSPKEEQLTSAADPKDSLALHLSDTCFYWKEGTSQDPNPEWTSPEVLSAIKKGKNKWFNYSAESPEGILLAKTILGIDSTNQKHDARGTLNALIDAAIKNQDIDVARAFKFL